MEGGARRRLAPACVVHARGSAVRRHDANVVLRLRSMYGQTTRACRAVPWTSDVASARCDSPFKHEARMHTALMYTDDVVLAA
eukprot:2863467-Pleurochrysis_carterae.AAC.1